MKHWLSILGKSVLSLCVILTIATLIRDWITQDNAPTQCDQSIGDLRTNGYVMIDFMGPTSASEVFKTKVVVVYQNSQHPPATINITRSASTNYGPEIITSPLRPFDKGGFISYDMDMFLPTPGVSQRHFPFDSPLFDFSLTFDPPLRPGVIIFRTASDQFIQDCSAFSTEWKEPGVLFVKAKFIRNPFIRSIAIIIGIAALSFGILLSRLRESDKLATAAASYFFSVWSVRNIVIPPDLPHPTFLDFWFMLVGIAVLMLVAWRLLDIESEPETNNKSFRSKRKGK